MTCAKSKLSDAGKKIKKTAKKVEKKIEKDVKLLSHCGCMHHDR